MQFELPPYARVRGDPVPPHPAQRQFHRLPTRLKFFRGGLGSGKSLAGSREFLDKIFSNHAYLKARGLKTKAQYIAAAPSYELTEAGCWNHIMAWLEEAESINGFRLAKKIQITKPRKITLITGDVIKFVSLDRPGMFAGVNAAGFWFDECELSPDPISGWQALVNRLRDNRFPDELLFGLATSTPRGFRGLSAHFADKLAQEDAEYGMVVAKTSDNPGATKGYIHMASATMSERERRQQLEGSLEAEDGAIYSHEYSSVESITVQRRLGADTIGPRWWNGPRSDRDYCVAIDWGTHYHALIIEHSDVDPRSGLKCRFGGTDIVVEEVVMDGSQDAEFLAAVCQRLQILGLDREQVEVYCDYNPRHSTQMAQQQRFFGDRVNARRVHTTDMKDEGIRTTRWRLRDAEGNRRLKFSPDLRLTANSRAILKCMVNYARKEVVIDGQRVQLGVNQDSPYSHGPDALRYYCWMRYQHLRLVENNTDAVVRSAA